MGNPFDALSSLFSGDGGSSGSPASDSKTPIDEETAAAGPSIFNRIFNPDKGGILGTIGDITGQHSNAERQAAVDADIKQKLTGFWTNNGKDEQRAILSLLNDPTGHALMSRPGAADTLKAWHDSIQPTVGSIAPGNMPAVVQGGKVSYGSPNPPADTQNWNNGVPQTNNTPAGTNTTVRAKNQPNQTISGPPTIANTPNGGRTGAFDTPTGQPIQGSAVSQPTNEAQNFTYFSSYLKGPTSEKEIANIARVQAMPNAAQQQTAAIYDARDRGIISPENAEKFVGNLLRVVPLVNAAGEDTHMFGVQDMTQQGKVFPMNQTTGQPIPQPPTGSAPQDLVVPPQTPGGHAMTFPAAGKQPDGSYDVQSMIAADPLVNMFLGSGILNHWVAIQGQVVRSLADPRNPELQSQLSAARHDKIDQFQVAVAQLGSLHNNRLAQVIEKWIDTTPSKFTDPKDAYNQAISLRKNLEQTLTMDQNMVDPSKGGGIISWDHDTVKGKMAEIAAIQNVLSKMPTVGQMQEMVHKIQVIPGTALSLSNAAQATGGLVSGMVNDALGGNQEGGGGAGTRAARLKERQQAAQPQAQLPSVEDIGKMDAAGIDALSSKLPKGKSPERDAAKARMKVLMGGQSGSPGTTPPGGTAPPAGNPSVPGQSNYDMQPASGSGKEATPPLEDWLKNPAGERNILYKGPNDTIEGAKYGSDGNWHVQQGGKWMTIVPIPGSKAKPSKGASSPL